MITDARRLFAAALAKLVSPMHTTDATLAIVALLEGCNDIGEAVFTDPMGLAFALGKDLERVPTLKALRKFLEAEQAKSGRAKPLPYADEKDLTDDDRRWIMFWQKHAIVSAGSDQQRAAERARNLATVRAHAPRAFDVIARDNIEDADIIARRHNWEPSWRRLQRQQTDWQDSLAVRSSARALRDDLPPGSMRSGLRRVLLAALGKFAPDNVWIVADVMDGDDVEIVEAERLENYERVTFPAPLALPPPDTPWDW